MSALRPCTVHPGRTAAERAALDSIGCGNYTPKMTNRVRDTMLDAGLIEECGLRGDPVRQFQMPVGVHMRWCHAVADSKG